MKLKHANDSRSSHKSKNLKHFIPKSVKKYVQSKSLTRRQLKFYHIATFIFIVIMSIIIITSVIINGRYIDNLTKSYGERAIMLAKVMSQQFDFTEERINELYSMDISLSRLQKDSQDFKYKVAPYINDDVTYVYFEVKLPAEKVKYHVMKDEAETCGVPAGTPLEYFYIYTSENENEYTDKMRFDSYNSSREKAYSTQKPSYAYFSNELWGKYITGYVPVFRDHKLIGMMGVDINADYLTKIIKSQKMLIAGFNILILLTFVVLLIQIFKSITKAPYFDQITGVYNGTYLRQLVTKQLHASENENIGSIIFNIDGFKKINEEYGSFFGDRLLWSLAERMKTLGSCNTEYVHLKADEFCIIFTCNNTFNHNTYYTEKLFSAFKEKLLVDDIPMLISITGGVVLINKKEVTASRFVEYLDYLLSYAKKNNRGTWTEFNPYEFSEFESHKERMKLIPEIIEQNQLYPVYQPIMDVKSCSLYGYEGLSRCTSKAYSKNIQSLVIDAGITGYHTAIQKLMMQNVLEKYMISSAVSENLKLFINESARSNFSKEEYIKLFNGLNRENLFIELTEYDVVEFSDMAQKINTIRSLNAKVALDDFGSGYSNVSTLLEINPDIVKLDRSLIHNIENEPRKKKFIEYIIKFADESAVKVLAECIETPEELKCLLELGVEYVQGYFIGKPSVDFNDISSEAREIVSNHLKGV